MEIDLDRSKQITILLFLLSVLGLAAIYFSIQNITPTEIEIGLIEDSMEGKMVKISGTIDNIRKSSSGNSYWTVDDGSNITVPILESKFKAISVKRGNFVEITGLVSKYQGELEVTPKEIAVR